MEAESLQENIQEVNLAKCPKGNQAAMVCSSQHCANRAFICNNKKCECRSLHKLCFQLSIESIMKIILAHSFSLEPLSKQIEALFDDAIDRLSVERDKIMDEIKKQEKFEYLGLSEMQTKFVDAVQKGTSDDQINCKIVWNIQNQFKEQNQVSLIQTQYKKRTVEAKQHLERHIIEDSNALRELFQKIKLGKILNKTFQVSKIVNGNQDQDRLLAFFTEKKVESAKILYRASQNDFLITKWHQKCDNIPNTLTIAETEYGKVIGGFTQFKWSKSNQWVSAANNEKSSFIFSLTNNDKFTITKNAQNAIFGYNTNENGPGFGGAHDFYIHNKANINTGSYAHMCFTYTNSNYIYDETNSHIKFSGGSSFRIKEWQVWEINFHK